MDSGLNAVSHDSSIKVRTSRTWYFINDEWCCSEVLYADVLCGNEQCYSALLYTSILSCMIPIIVYRHVCVVMRRVVCGCKDTFLVCCLYERWSYAVTNFVFMFLVSAPESLLSP